MSQLSITLIQANLFWEDKARNLQQFEEKIDKLGKTEIVILPEMFSTGFSMASETLAEDMNGPTIEWMRKLSARKKIILTGSLIISEGGHYYNRLVWMLPNGQFGYYDKRHRFAFAGEDNFYTAGSKRLIASVKGWRVNLLICYDLRFPVWSRQKSRSAEGEYDLLIYVANWPDKRINAWRTLLVARAIENQCFVAGVNRVGNDNNNIHYSGESIVASPMGEILYQKKDEEDVFTITLDKQTVIDTRERFPFWRDADEFQLIDDPIND